MCKPNPGCGENTQKAANGLIIFEGNYYPIHGDISKDKKICYAWQGHKMQIPMLYKEIYDLLFCNHVSILYHKNLLVNKNSNF